MHLHRPKITYSVLIFVIIVLGLGSRRYAEFLPTWMAAYAGDTLWALMVFLALGFVCSTMRTRHVAIIALLFSYAIEISQLYHAPWIDGIRHTVLGGLILGYGFLWSDLVCYTVGVTMGVLLEILLQCASANA